MDNCKCINNSCIKCKDVELNKAKQKLDRYEQALKILMDDSIIQDTYLGNNKNDGSNLFESVIMDKNMRGEVVKKHNSRLGESYIILDKGKNLDTINNKEKAAIDEQDNLKRYEKAKTYAKKGSYLYGMVGMPTKVAGFFIGLF